MHIETMLYSRKEQLTQGRVGYGTPNHLDMNGQEGEGKEVLRTQLRIGDPREESKGTTWTRKGQNVKVKMGKIK